MSDLDFLPCLYFLFYTAFTISFRITDPIFLQSMRKSICLVLLIDGFRQTLISDGIP